MHLILLAADAGSLSSPCLAFSGSLSLILQGASLVLGMQDLPAVDYAGQALGAPPGAVRALLGGGGGLLAALPRGGGRGLRTPRAPAAARRAARRGGGDQLGYHTDSPLSPTPIGDAPCLVTATLGFKMIPQMIC